MRLALNYVCIGGCMTELEAIMDDVSESLLLLKKAQIRTLKGFSKSGAELSDKSKIVVLSNIRRDLKICSLLYDMLVEIKQQHPQFVLSLGLTEELYTILHRLRS